MPAQDEFPYVVELWDDAGACVEQVLALTTHGPLGFAAYYAATQEHPARHVSLRCKERILVSSAKAPPPPRQARH